MQRNHLLSQVLSSVGAMLLAWLMLAFLVYCGSVDMKLKYNGLIQNDDKKTPSDCQKPFCHTVMYVFGFCQSQSKCQNFVGAFYERCLEEHPIYVWKHSA